jgi:transcription initiation factor TFIIIB Brf1 subunit/transcription initiation factor TFIIB
MSCILSSQVDECTHETLNIDGSCSVCGMVCHQLYSTDPSVSNPYTTTHSLIKTIERSLHKDMEHLAIPDDVKQKANQIYQSVPIGTKRGNKRRQLVYWCIFNAFLELGYQKNPKEIAQLVGIKPNEITKANSAYSEIQTGYRSVGRVVEFSPIHFIPQYCHKLSLDESYIEQTMTFTKSLLQRSPSLLDKTPQAIAAGIIIYNLGMLGVNVNNKKFAEIVELSEVTIAKAYRLVAHADNTYN